ncbi:cellulase family glycosylhydrolase [Acuticoccus mangrovi]|uniref:cellulase n=1 Tax=Acuticoccus mangrovi TaxID=2796142 RepID=A0A934IG18_9HYPH|nr:cellulase family glycosylhydrolase [Acuticoccus mangrovi]MBJ3774316.1 cellulase family glycosylhydrolase [Acuticoccus mangrovi]
MIDVSFTDINNWGAGFQGEFKLSNSGSAVSGWLLSFTANFEISQIWGARIVSHVGDTYVVENLSWNATIGSGSEISFGFIGRADGATPAVDEIAVNDEPVDDVPDLPVLTVDDVVVAEDGGSATLTVRLDEAADGPVSADYRTVTGTAGAADFTGTSGTLTFAAGETTAEIVVAITDDGEIEADEGFTLVFENADGAEIGDGEATVTIVSEDVAPPPSITIEASQAVAEGDVETGAAAGWFSTSGSDIVDANGDVVRLTGVNWFGAETTRMAPDGLHTRNWQDMMDQMADLGFNTIRLPFSNDALRDGATPSGINYALNPDLAGLSPIEIIDKIVDYAGEIGMRIILDNHRNAAGDGASSNGLWYGEGYSQDDWIADWQMLAERYADDPTVVGLDLSNEPHSATWGDGNLATDWRLGAEAAIEAIHAVNPEVLVLVEGIGGDYWWGGNLKGVASAPIRLDATDKLVYSPHAYPNSIYSQPWFSDPDFPDNLTDKWDENWGYIAKEGIAPVLLGEFGSRLEDAKDVAWFDEMVPYLEENGLSFTYWSWNPNSGDTGGILADDWTTVVEAKMDLLEAALGDALPTDGGTVDTTTVAIAVSLSEAASHSVSVDYATVDGTAIAGVDYEATSGTVTFDPGETTVIIEVDVLRDGVAEDDRSFDVVLSDPDGGELDGARTTITILDDDEEGGGEETPDAVPVVSIAGLEVEEGDGTAYVRLTLDGAASEDVAVTVAASGGSADGDDFDIGSGAVLFAAGETEAFLAVNLVDDDEVEGTETATLRLTGADGATIGDDRATLTILDNDEAAPPEEGDANGDGVYSVISVRDSWSSGFVADGTVFNESGAGIDGWTVSFALDGEIVNIWNAAIVSHTGDTYVIGSLGYNDSVASGGSTGWGFQAQGLSDSITVGDVIL